MSSTPGYAERVVLGEERGFLSWIIRILLWPLSVIYRLGLALYLALYKIGIRRKYKLPVPVISVGNITFGGTGKTPAVQTICKLLLENGKRVAVLSRGHGGKAIGSVVVSDGKSILVDVSVSGDEPMLIARSLPEVPVIVGKDRRISGKLACELFNPDVILLDDGMQYWQLHRDLDVAVLDSKRPFGSGFLMPMGDLREPVSGLKRAGIVLLSNCSELDNKSLEKLKSKVNAIAPQADVFLCYHVPVKLTRVADGEEICLEWLRGRSAVAFCGIGKPGSFIKTLESLQVSVKNSVIFPDHHIFSDSDINKIMQFREEFNAEIIITTEKDAVRIKPAQIDNLYSLGIKLEIGDFSRFGSIIKQYV